MGNESCSKMELLEFLQGTHGEVVCLPKNAFLPITLRSRQYEVSTVVLVKELSDRVYFAPIGLIKVFNSGGAINELDDVCHWNFQKQNVKS